MPAVGGGRGGVKNAPIVVFNPTTAGAATVAPTTSSAPSGGGTKPLGSGKGGSGAGAGGKSTTGSSSYDKYLAQQKREASKAKHDAAVRYMTDAANMQGQVDALKQALKSEFREALDTKLGNLDVLTGQQIDQLMVGYQERRGSLEADSQNNKISAGDATARTDMNRARERASALSEVANQGGGESDGLRAQLMSLRSGEANMAEINRAFHDTERSINSARIDLGGDTRTALANIYSEADADRAQLWNDFYGQKAETFTQLGNTLGQQAEYYGMAAEQGGAKLQHTAGSTGRLYSNEVIKGGGRPGGKGRPTGQLVQDLGGKGAGLVGGRAQLRTTPGGGQGSATRGGGKTTALGGNGGRKGAGKLGPKQTSLQAQEEAARASDRAFMQAAHVMGKAYESQGIPDDVMKFQGPQPENTVLASSLLQNARTTISQKRPEGATLRKW